MSSSPTPQKVNVRSIISIFENQSNQVSNETSKLSYRSKSLGNLNYLKTTPQVRVTHNQNREPVNDLQLTQIEQEVNHLQKTLNNNYKTYSRETHVNYQNQIVFLLSDLCNVDTKSNPRLIDTKSELCETLKRLNKKLNALLPSSPSTYVNNSIPKIVKSKSVEEKRETFALRKSVSERKLEDDEVDSLKVSVKTLKELFEKNTGDEGKSVKESSMKRFHTFHGTGDLNSYKNYKYVPYSERQKDKSLEDDEDNEKRKEEEKEAPQNGMKSEDVSQDSLSGSEESEKSSEDDDDDED